MPGPRNSRVARRAAAALILGLAAVPAVAQDAPAEGGPAAAEGIRVARAPVALLRGLDKVTGATTDLALATGEAATYGRLEIRLGECRYPVEDPESDAFAELTITDMAARRTVFAGWMIASSPALSALDDARYDVWVVSCQSAAASGSGPDSEAADDSAEASSD